MIKNLGPFLAAAACVALCAFAWLNVSPLAACGVAALSWLGFTWYFADDEPLFGGPPSALRVTFKQVLANAINDVRELFDRITNMVFVALAALDTVIISTPELKAAVLASDYGLGVILVLNLVTTIAARRPA